MWHCLIQLYEQNILSALLVAPLLLGQAPGPQGAARKKWPSTPAAWLDPDKGEPGGTHYKTFHSKLVGGEVSYLIYLPPSYETNSRSDTRWSTGCTA